MINTQNICDSSNISIIADVSPSTVTNWKRRHADFPAPIDFPTVLIPLYDLDEIMTWLHQHNKI